MPVPSLYSTLPIETRDPSEPPFEGSSAPRSDSVVCASHASDDDTPDAEAPDVASSGGGPGVLEDPTVDEETSTSPGRLWHVIVWNDPINLMSYVAFVLQKLFGYSVEVATRLMLEVHQQGKSIVATVEREKAEYYVARLHQFGLQATLERQSG